MATHQKMGDVEQVLITGAPDVILPCAASS
jgi:hypothetical protein